MISIVRRVLGALMISMAAYWAIFSLFTAPQNARALEAQGELHTPMILAIIPIIIWFVTNTLSGALLFWKGKPMQLLSLVALGGLACIYLLVSIEIGEPLTPVLLYDRASDLQQAIFLGCMLFVAPILYLADLLLPPYPPWLRFGGPKDG